MRRTLFLFLTFLLMTAVVGCSSSSSDNDVSGDTTAQDTSGDTTMPDSTEPDSTEPDSTEPDSTMTDVADATDQDTTTDTVEDTVDDTTTTTDGINVYTQVNDIHVPPGGDYFDTTADGIALYSFSRHSLKLRNNGTTDAVINSVTLAPTGNLQTEEWTIVDPDQTAIVPLVVSDVTVAAGEQTFIDVYFYPTVWGMRTAEITVTWNTTETYTFTVTGRGRDNGVLFSGGATTWEKIMGDPAEDTLSGAAVGDGTGKLYISGNVNGWLDGFSEDLVVAQVNGDGSLGWSKVWNESYEQLSPDPGQNGESGGGADSMSYGGDDHIYLVGRRSQSSANSVFQTMVLKIAVADGAIAWSKGWSPTANNPPSIASQSSLGYGVDASMSDRVLVTGENGGNVSLIALSKTDGSILFDMSIDAHATLNDRGYSVRADGAGNAYIGGIGDGHGLLIRLTGVDTATPAIDWVKEIQMITGGNGTGSNINSVDVDAAGNAYVSLDRRGATTYFTAARFDTDGTLAWAKTFDDANSGDSNNTYVVRVNGSDVYVGGRIAFTPFDTQFGEGFLMKLGTADGAYGWSSFYYTGKGAEEMAEGRIKGIVFDGSDLMLLMQSYTNSLDFAHYWGHWYDSTDAFDSDPTTDNDGAARMADYSPTINDLTSTTTTSEYPNGTSHNLDSSTAWVDPPADVTYEDLRTREGGGGDGDNVIMKMTLQ